MITQTLSIDEARDELNEVALEVQRARWLYSEVAWNPVGVIPSELRPDFKIRASTGFFEPLRLFFCWADYLGALYTGNGRRGENRARIMAWLSFMWNDEVLAEDVCDGYRNHLVHARAPAKHSISFGKSDEHLQRRADGPIRLDVPTLLNQLIDSVGRYSQSLVDEGDDCGSLEAFNRALAQMA